MSKQSVVYKSNALRFGLLKERNSDTYCNFDEPSKEDNIIQVPLYEVPRVVKCIETVG